MSKYTTEAVHCIKQISLCIKSSQVFFYCNQFSNKYILMRKSIKVTKGRPKRDRNPARRDTLSTKITKSIERWK